MIPAPLIKGLSVVIGPTFDFHIVLQVCIFLAVSHSQV